MSETATSWKFRVEGEAGLESDERIGADPGGPANTEHHHRGLGLLTPADVHHGRVEQRRAARATVLATAYAAHPERFSAGLPQPAPCPTEVWINPPPTRAIEEALTH